MSINFSKWGKAHQTIARNYQNLKQATKLSSDIFQWIKNARPQVEGKTRNFLIAPFWVPIYSDISDYIMIMGGRQIFKSTACTDFLAHEATANSGIQACYITHDQGSLSAFSKQKLRIGTFLTNPVLRKFLRHPGNVGEVSLKNNSTIYLVTDNNEFIHLEGKSPTLCVLDEAQYLDLEFFGKITQTMMATKGKTKIFGIGGEAGSPYEILWKETDQKEWQYDDPEWRAKLQFNKDGLVIGDYLNEILSGCWMPQSNSEFFSGYHIPQTIFPTIPLTEQDAIEKYKIHPRFSIEYQKNTFNLSTFCSHVLGQFYNSPHRPITKEMLLRCTDPYRYLSLLKGNESREMKATFGDEIEISMGVDFGSGSSSFTAIAIVILWKKSKRIQLVHIEKRPPENQINQARYIAALFRAFACDIGVGDLGYGANQIKIIQEGGQSIDTGRPFRGVTSDKFYGCRTISDVTKPFQIFDEAIDEHGDTVGRIQVDKTSCIEDLINNINGMISCRGRCCSRLIIPFKNDFEVNFLIKDMLNITRKDMHDKDRITDPRQQPKKEYNHPPDSVMALFYSFMALKILEETVWHWISA